MFWTDSTYNEDKRFHTFVENRFSAITAVSSPSQWRHAGSKDNPADAASRGMKVFDFLKNYTWLEGPSDLWKSEKDWPANYVGDVKVDSDDPAVRKVSSVNSVVNNSPKSTDYFMTYFSDWKRLKVSVAWFLRLKAILLELSCLRKGLKASDNAQAGQMERLKATITQRSKD